MIDYRITAIALVLISLIAVFYWFQIRPSEVRQVCLQELRDFKEDDGSSIKRGHAQEKYDICFIEKGLKPEKLFNL